MSALRPLSPSGSRSWRGGDLELIAASTSAVLVALRLPLPIPFSLLVSVALLPVTMRWAVRYVGAISISVAAVVCAAAGYLLTLGAVESGASISRHLLISNSAEVLAIPLAMLTLLWARSVAGDSAAVIGYALGTFLSLGFVGINLGNPWKFSFAVPVTMLLLGLPWLQRRWLLQAGVLLLLAAVSAVNDSRSATAMMLIAAALVLTQAGGSAGRTRARTGMVLARIVLVGLGGYYMIKAAALEGVLGEAAESRTQAQIDQSGSLLLGGRPEAGAALSLIERNPTGYGSGTLARWQDLTTGMTGMANLGYDPHNGYVRVYMFGQGFEVHSVLGDLWIRFGLSGAALVMLIAVFSVYGLARALAQKAASGIMIYLTLRLLWDIPFSPAASAALTMPLALALVLPARSQPGDQVGGRSAHEGATGHGSVASNP